MRTVSGGKGAVTLADTDCKGFGASALESINATKSASAGNESAAKNLVVLPD